jgi:hypothetical protein
MTGAAGLSWLMDENKWILVNLESLLAFSAIFVEADCFGATCQCRAQDGESEKEQKSFHVAGCFLLAGKGQLRF